MSLCIISDFSQGILLALDNKFSLILAKQVAAETGSDRTSILRNLYSGGDISRSFALLDTLDCLMASGKAENLSGEAYKNKLYLYQGSMRVLSSTSGRI